MNIKGLRTFGVALLMAVVPAVTTYLGNINWVELLADLGVSPKWQAPLAGIVASVVMAGMRSITSTPPAKDSHDA